MALTTRGKALIAGGAVVAVLGGGVAALALSGDNPVAKALDPIVPGDQTPPTPCPLTNQPVGGDKEPPARPALAVKVENTPDAMPLVGLDKADIVYEEVVEGGITRFIVVFNCSSAERVGPVRSARTTDPKILLQFSPHPLLAYSGGANRVVNIIKESGVVGMTEGDPEPPFTRDDAREVPHNLFANTNKLWVAGQKRAKDEPVPEAIFTLRRAATSPARRPPSAMIAFPLTDVEWRWAGRPLGPLPERRGDGAGERRRDRDRQRRDPAGEDLRERHRRRGGLSLARGRGHRHRQGVVAARRQARSSARGSAPPRATSPCSHTKKGDEFQLKPGTTFVELAPTGMFTAPVDLRES